MIVRRFTIFWIAVLLSTAIACSTTGSAPQTVSEIAGVYSDATELNYAATSIRLHTDGTFTYSYFSCTTDRRTTGEWRLIAPNLILANSFVHQEPSSLEGRLDRSSNTVSVTVVDSDGAGIPGTKITVKCQDGNIQYGVSGKGGIGVLERCDVVQVSADLVGFQHAEAKPRNRKHNVFTISLRVYPWFHIQDQLLYVDEAQLFEVSRPPLGKIRE